MTIIGMRGCATALVAATLLTAAAPASAAPNGFDAPRSGFHHHFYRGVPGQNRGNPDADTTAVYADAGAQDAAATAYCADRFRSYDPTNGTYLGYDGDQHACP